MPLALLSASFQSLSHLPTSKWGPSGTGSRVSGFVYILGPCGSLQWTLLWGWSFSHHTHFPQVFSVRGFEALFSCTGTLGCIICLTPQLFLLVYLHANVEPSSPSATTLPGPPASALQWVLSAPPIGLDECFFFNSLVVGFPYSSIFCQFWLPFVFKFAVALLVVWGGIVCLPMPPSWLEAQKLHY